MRNSDSAMNDFRAEPPRLQAWQLEVVAFLALACAIAWACVTALGIAPQYWTEGDDAIVLTFLVAAAGVATLLSWLIVGAHRAPPSFGQLIACAAWSATLFVVVQLPALVALRLLLGWSAEALTALRLLSTMLAVGAVGFVFEGVIALFAGLAGAMAYGFVRWLLLWLVRQAARR